LDAFLASVPFAEGIDVRILEFDLRTVLFLRGESETSLNAVDTRCNPGESYVAADRLEPLDSGGGGLGRINPYLSTSSPSISSQSSMPPAISYRSLGMKLSRLVLKLGLRRKS